MTTAYTPHAGSIAARALAHLESLSTGIEVPTAVLAEALSTDTNMINVCLQTAWKHRLLVREKRDGRVYWRLGNSATPAPAPDPEDEAGDDAQPVARTIASTEAKPLGLAAQSWCPAAQESGRSSSLDEPAASHSNPPIAASPGLGWVAPRLDPGITFESAHPTLVVDGATIGDETVRALSAALAPTPDDSLVVETEFDPDFREVASADTASLQVPLFIPPKPKDQPTLPLHVGNEFRCALWSNGELEMQLTSGRLVRLSAEDTRGLLRYVSDSLSARARAAA